MIKRALEIEIEKIHPEIVAMAKEILDLYSKEDVMHTSSEIAALYNWTIEVVRSFGEKGTLAQLPPEPSDPEERLEFRKDKQRAIFGIVIEDKKSGKKKRQKTTQQTAR